MTKNQPVRHISELRRQAEERARSEKPVCQTEETPEGIQQTLYELRVNQIELELQSEALCAANAKTEAWRKRYFDLYDTAPVGYMTLSDKGLILEANLTAANLLGMTRDALADQPITRFILKDDQYGFHLHSKQFFETGVPQQCRLHIAKSDGTSCWAHLEIVEAAEEVSGQACRVILSDITEHKPGDKTLVESETLNLRRFVMNSTLFGFWDWNIKDNTEYLSPTFKHMFGYKDHEMENSPESWKKIIFNEDLPAVLEALDIHIKSHGKKPFHKEVRYRHKDGSTVWVICVGNVMEWAEDGAAIRMVGCHVDITERKEIEEKLKVSQELLSEAEMVSKVGGWSFHIDTMVQKWTDEVFRIHEIDITDTPTVDSGINYYTEASKPIISKAVQRAIEHGENYDLELEIITAKGNLRTVHTIGKADLKNRRIYGFFQDITERKQAERELRRLSMAIDQSAEAVLITDIEGIIQYVNPAFETISGYTRKEAIGRNPAILKSGQHSAEFYKTMWNTLKNGNTWEGKIVNRRKDGKEYTEEVTISPVRDKFGAIANFVAVKHDITSELVLEAQLRQAQKMESVGRLAGGVAHDFNNMLMGILGYTDMCKDEIGEDHPIREYLDEITHCAQRSAEITRQLLAFAKKQKITPKVLNLNDALSSMLKLLKRLIGEHINLKWCPGSQLNQVKIDPSQLDQILVNLCVNARDAIDGVGSITLETGRITIDPDDYSKNPEAVPGAYVFLAVSDDGPGIDQETLAQIFEPFFTTKEAGEGTGLGLATVYGIVKQNHGFIQPSSEPGKGTTFKVFLPETMEKPGASTPTNGLEAVQGKGETVLLVEDEKSLRLMCSAVLNQLGYQVLIAENPEEALKIAEGHQGVIHALLTDVVMPGMGGRQLAQNIRAVNPGIKVLFMSGYTSDIITQHGFLDKGTHFLSKPFSRDDLARKLHDALEAN